MHRFRDSLKQFETLLQQTRTPQQKRELLNLLGRRRNLVARRCFLTFCQQMMNNFITNWHHRVIADRLSLLPYQKAQRIMIFLQPQVGKSLLVSRLFPAWFLGQAPDSKIISSSYGLSLAEGFNTDCQQYIESKAYQDIFHIDLPTSGSKKKRTQSFFQIEGADGYLYSVGVGGPTVGKTAHCFIIDDPIKGPTEAFSISSRNKIIDWYNAVVETRLSLDAHVILMHQRWHQQDLAGYLLSRARETGEEWEVLYFPCLSTENPHPLDPRRRPGIPLWPEFKGDKEFWDLQFKKAGPYFASAIYQQDPAGQEAALVSEKDIEFYDPTTMSFEGMTQGHSWDMNFKSKEEQAKGSYVVGQHWATDNHNFYIRNQARGKWGFRETVNQFTRFYNAAPCSEVLIEDKANGPAILSTFEGIVPGLTPIEPKGDKYGRYAAVSPLFHSRRVFLPNPDKIVLDSTGRNWVKVLIEELIGFPNTENDDQVDAASQYLSYKWDPSQEGIFNPFSATGRSKWALGGSIGGRPNF